MVDARVRATVNEQPYPLLFATISGAHLYGFPSPDSDYDVRGVHVLPLRELVGLDMGPATLEETEMRAGLEIDLVTHEVHKFCTLLLKKNGYVLEQLYSPLIVHTTAVHEELKTIAHNCITRHHHHHYAGFAATQWRLFLKEQPRRVKPLLYVFRVLLTGIQLMQTGWVEANLVHLNATFHLPYLEELIQRKLMGPELATLEDDDVVMYQREYERLMDALDAAATASTLPAVASGRAALHDFLVRLRLPAANG